MFNRFTLLIFITLIVYYGNAQDKFTKMDLENDSFSELERFFPDSALSAYSVFFTGENHTYGKVNSQTEFKLLTYLHEKSGVNHFLFEQGPALGHIINQITLENDLDNRFYLKDRFYKPFFELVTKIRIYNEKQPDSLKIITHGIDIERFPAFSIHVLNDMVDSLPIQGKTGRVYESIKALGSSEFVDGTPDDIYNGGGTLFNLNGDVIDAWTTFETIINDAKKVEHELANELGDDYQLFKEILLSVDKGHQWYHEERKGDLSGPITRERYMIDQFERISKRFENAKFYGQFGRCHLHSNKKAKRCYSYDMTSISKRISELNDSIYNGKVMTIPILYKTHNGYDKEIIKSLYLDHRFEGKNESFLIDLAYLQGNNPLIGFSNSLKYAIVNTYQTDGYENEYNFDYKLEEIHIGVNFAQRKISQLNGLNNALNTIGSGLFSTIHNTYQISIDYFDLRSTGMHFDYTFIPEISNGDRFKLKGNYASFGTSYPMGNKFGLAAIGLNYAYGNYVLREEILNSGTNLIQEEGKNIVVYSNDLLYLEPNLDLRLTFPIISLNAKIGYSWDVSNKYWKLEKQVREFTKTSFSAPYIMIGASFNYKDQY